ncbi:MAG: hypothetical protein ABIR83_06660 [Nakamurella sp.]
MVKTSIRSIVWLAVILLLLAALVGVTPTQAGEFVRAQGSNVLEFIRSVFGGNLTAT